MLIVLEGKNARGTFISFAMTEFGSTTVTQNPINLIGLVESKVREYKDKYPDEEVQIFIENPSELWNVSPDDDDPVVEDDYPYDDDLEQQLLLDTTLTPVENQVELDDDIVVSWELEGEKLSVSYDNRTKDDIKVWRIFTAPKATMSLVVPSMTVVDKEYKVNSDCEFIFHRDTKDGEILSSSFPETIPCLDCAKSVTNVTLESA